MTETERLRELLTERGTDFEVYDMGHADGNLHGEPTRETTWTAENGLSVTFVEYPSGATRLRVWEPTAQQALDMAGRGSAMWDGDVLILTLPRDPSSVHVQRADGQPRKVYPSQAELGRGDYTYEQWREISDAIGDAMEYAHDKAVECPDKADPLWNLDEYVERVLKAAFGAKVVRS